jgi:hypothetical protein
MSKQVWIILGVVAGVGLLSCACCGVGAVFFALPKIRLAADRVNRTNQLKVIGLAVHNFMNEKARGPADADELAPYLIDSLGVETLQRLRKRDIEMVWNAANLPQQTDGNSNVLIAWEARPEPDGKRLVVFLDGHTDLLPEAQFQTTLKARTAKK